MKKANIQSGKVKEMHKPKCCDFASVPVLVLPLPSRGFGPPARNRGHMKDNSNYAWFGMEGPSTQKALERKYSGHLLFCLFFNTNKTV